MTDNRFTIEQHFTGRAPAVRATYDRLIATTATLGTFDVDPKKTSIHLNRKSAFAGVVTRKVRLILTLKLASVIQSTRIQRREQVSANRWHLEIPLSNPEEVDQELLEWLRQAYSLSS